MVFIYLHVWNSFRSAHFLPPTITLVTNSRLISYLLMICFKTERAFCRLHCEWPQTEPIRLAIHQSTCWKGSWSWYSDLSWNLTNVMLITNAAWECISFYIFHIFLSPFHQNIFWYVKASVIRIWLLLCVFLWNFPLCAWQSKLRLNRWVRECVTLNNNIFLYTQIRQKCKQKC